MKAPSLKAIAALSSLPLLFSLASAQAQTAAMIARPTPPAATAPTAVPNLVPYSGLAQSREGKALTGDIAATFLIFKDEQGGEPLWVETQSVTLDPTGRYQVQLGASSSSGLPASTFATGEGRWLEVQISGQEPQPRILLSSVPYAMKASDAETLGGLSARNFVTQAQLASAAKSLATQAVAQITPDVTLTGTGVTNYVPVWTSASNLGDSVIYQSTTKVGINTTAPTASLHVVGPTNGAIGMVLQSGGGAGSLRVGGDVNASTVTPSVRKVARFSMPDWAADTQGVLLFSGDITSATTNDMYFGGATGSPLYGPTTLHFFTSPTSTTVGGTEKMTITSAGNVGISAQNPTAKLEVNGTAKFDGNITFASTQTFPITGTGGGTITAVNPGTGLTGGGTSGAVALAVNPAVVPLLTTANTFTAAQTISSGNLSISNGNINLPATTPTGGTINIAGVPYLSACCAGSTRNSFLGNNAGGTSASAVGNSGIGEDTGVGFGVLFALTSGFRNTAVGANALAQEDTGSDNTAIGDSAFLVDAGGTQNTVVGSGALEHTELGYSNTAIGVLAGVTTTRATFRGADNTFLGAQTGPGATTVLSGSTAIGFNAQVSEDYALALGGQGGDAVAVGIGTATPYKDYALDVESTPEMGLTGAVVANAQGGNIYLGMTNTVHKFRVDTNGAVYADGGLNATGADFAESMAVHGAKALYEPGDLMIIDRKAKRSLALSRTPYSTLVAGIYSTRPGMLASPHHIDDKEIGKEVPLAVVGIVPCKVTAQNGPIREGDLLVTSSRPGYAMKGIDRQRMLGAVVGKALEPLTSKEGVIQVLVTLQ